MSGNTDITDTDLGYEGIIDAIKMSKTIHLDAGFFEDATPYPAENGVTSVAQVAAMQEEGFSIPDKKFRGVQMGPTAVPPRPFMKTACNKKQEEWIARFGNALDEVFDRDGLKQALEVVGEFMQADIQETIEEFSDPPNSELYVKQSKPDIGNNPLIRTRHMKNSVDFKIRTKWDS